MIKRNYKQPINFKKIADKVFILACTGYIPMAFPTPMMRSDNMQDWACQLPPVHVSLVLTDGAKNVLENWNTFTDFVPLLWAVKHLTVWVKQSI